MNECVVLGKENPEARDASDTNPRFVRSGYLLVFHRVDMLPGILCKGDMRPRLVRILSFNTCRYLDPLILDPVPINTPQISVAFAGASVLPDACAQLRYRLPETAVQTPV